MAEAVEPLFGEALDQRAEGGADVLGPIAGEGRLHMFHRCRSRGSGRRCPLVVSWSLDRCPGTICPILALPLGLVQGLVLWFRGRPSVAAGTLRKLDAAEVLDVGA